MRISRYRRSHPQQHKTPERYKVNRSIASPELRVIDEEGVSHGVLPTSQAIALAEERGFDLVEVNPIAEPPIAKLLNYGQFKYEKEREMRKQKVKAKQVEVKGIRLSVRIGAHDIDIRLKQAEEFLAEGNKVKIEIILKGREKAFAHLAAEVINKFIDALNATVPVRTEQPLSRQGGKISAVVGKASAPQTA